MRLRLVEMLVICAPPRPACFEDDTQWTDWLVLAHRSGVKVVQRNDVFQRSDRRATFFTPLPTDRIDYCEDCTADRRAQMMTAGRCSPPKNVPPKLPATQPTHEREATTS